MLASTTQSPYSPRLPRKPITPYQGTLSQQYEQALGYRPLVAAAPTPPAYQGTLNQQYDQALGVRPRYVPRNQGLQRLSSMYDDAMGYTT